MVQEFHVLKCYSCQTFQVHQVKKSKKWICKMCGEKQSLIKEFGRGSGADCRRHVQKLNGLQGERMMMEVERAASLLWEETTTEHESPMGGGDALSPQQIDTQGGPQVSRWSKFLQRPDAQAGPGLEPAHESEEEENDGVYLDRDRFHVNKNVSGRKRKRQGGVGAHGDDGGRHYSREEHLSGGVGLDSNQTTCPETNTNSWKRRPEQAKEERGTISIFGVKNPSKRACAFATRHFVGTADTGTALSNPSWPNTAATSCPDERDDHQPATTISFPPPPPPPSSATSRWNQYLSTTPHEEEGDDDGDGFWVSEHVGTHSDGFGNPTTAVVSPSGASGKPKEACAATTQTRRACSSVGIRQQIPSPAVKTTLPVVNSLFNTGDDFDDWF